MKTNMFNEVILQPGDDIAAAFADSHGLSDDAVLTARFIEHDDVCGWSCTVSDEEGDEMQVHDFESEDALRTFLTTQGVEIDD